MNKLKTIIEFDEITTLCQEQKFTKAIDKLKKLYKVTVPNNLHIYLSIKSIKADIENGKDNDLISNNILVIQNQILGFRLTKSERFSNFAIAVMSYTLIPLMPFLANWLNNKQNSNENIILSIAIYCISIALSIKYTRDRMIGIIMSILVFLLVRENPTQQAMLVSFIVTFIIFLLHVTDRAKRHLIEHEPYLNIKR